MLGVRSRQGRCVIGGKNPNFAHDLRLLYRQAGLEVSVSFLLRENGWVVIEMGRKGKH